MAQERGLDVDVPPRGGRRKLDPPGWEGKDESLGENLLPTSGKEASTRKDDCKREHISRLL